MRHQQQQKPQPHYQHDINVNNTNNTRASETYTARTTLLYKQKQNKESSFTQTKNYQCNNMSKNITFITAT